MKEHFMRVMKHDYWASERLLQTMRQLPWIPIKAKEIFDHIIAAEVVWYARIAEINPEIPVWKSNLDMASISTLLNECHQRWMELLESDEDVLSKKITYQNSSGKEFTNTAAEVLTHLSLHSQYHRGQVIILIRDQVEHLPSTDYIMYLRESSFLG
jgi:uncharacterized damage-inducible protein DinB